MESKTLIVFDFSGTLSLTAVAFGRPGNMEKVLRTCGLADLGISLHQFWEEIVYPTWMEGSTTSRGYHAVLADRIAGLGFQFPHDPAPRQTIQKSVSCLLDQYFDQCRIDLRWRRLLVQLSREPAVRIVIATDHYAEATQLIKERLDAWHIRSRALLDEGEEGGGPVLIANSADLGFHKADARFWILIRDKLLSGRRGRLFLVDDFGANEDSSDPYGNPGRVIHRRGETMRVLQEVFAGEVTIHVFDIKQAKKENKEASIREAQTGRQIEAAISGIQTFLLGVATPSQGRTEEEPGLEGARRCQDQQDTTLPDGKQ